MQIRRAGVADAPLLARVAEQWFRDAFEADNDPAQMAAFCRAHYGLAQQTAELEHPSRITLLAEEAGDPVGFAQLLPGARPPVRVGSNPVELERFYVSPARIGRGVARVLMERCFEASRQAGADSIWLGVWQDNPRAIAFYRKCDYKIVGEQEFLLGSEVQDDYIMMRSLVP